jgi:hypothetical protein
LGTPVVILLAIGLRAQRDVADHQRQPVRVVLGHRQRLRFGGIDGVRRPVDVEVEPRDDEVLMERGICSLVDERAVRRLLALREVRRDHDPGRPDLALDATVLVEAPVDEVLIVGDGDVERHYEPSGPAHLGAVQVVHVLPEDRVVLLVDADGVRDRARFSPGVVDHGVDIGDLAEAIAAQLQRRRHEAQAPLADVEGGPPVVVRGGISVRHDHLGERKAVGDWAEPAAVVVADGVQNQAFPVVESQPQLPVLPGQ